MPANEGTKTSESTTLLQAEVGIGDSVNSRRSGNTSSVKILDDEHFNAAKDNNNNTTTQQSSSANTSIVVGRPRSRTLLAEQRDQTLQAEEKERTFVQKYKKVLILVPYIFLNGMSTLFVVPFIPAIMKDYFGSDKRAAEITSYVAAVTAIIGMFTAAFYGKLLDTVGRKPFFVLAPIFQKLVPILLLLLLPTNPLPYMFANAAGSLIQSSFTSSYIADSYSTLARVKVFAIVEAAGSFVALGAIVNTFLSDTTCKVLGVSFAAAATLYGFFVIRESIPEDVKRPMNAATAKSMFTTNPFGAMRFLLSSKVCRAVIAIIACFLFALVGSTDIFVYYVNSRVGFSIADTGYILFEDGLLTPFVLLVLLPIMSKYLSPTMIIFISLTACLTQLIVIATIWARWVAFVIVLPLVDFSMLMIPLLLAVLANSGNPADQGRRLTGFAAVVDLCEAIGPLVFGAIYGNVSGTLQVLPFIIGAVLLVPAGAVAWHLPRYLQEEKDAKTAGQVAQ